MAMHAMSADTGPPLLPAWATEFSSFGLLHALTAGALIGAMVVSIVLGRRWLGTWRERALRGVWIGWTVVWQAWAVVWYLLPAQFDVAESLPLHLCDLAAWVAPLALLTQKRFLRTLLFFWGLGLSTQAFVTPVLSEGVTDVRFWLFWIGHTQIVGSAAYDLLVLRYRPTWRDYVLVTIVNVVIIGVMIPLNLLLDANYWYVGNLKPEHPTLIDRLGPWPLRVVWMLLIGQGALAVLWGIGAWVGREVQAAAAEEGVATEIDARDGG
ncbi:MAG: TIGR02206 family membrane protein [Phycisphaeraceae bacterium]|nr:TIGR02206 family membrane protein [Phycisphaeraceae bacterium]MCW5764284.1 TIGR02206 family membrane protein [Phycisphaeraceae bacterium]